MRNGKDLRELLKLSPLSDPPRPLDEWLLELKDNFEWADTAPAVILRSILAQGKEKPEDEPDPERRQFLQLLREMCIPSFNAFKHVTGSQLFALRVVNFLQSARGNGAQLKKMMIVEGGPGSGKDYFKDGIVKALEEHARVWAVKGCPDHESPLNLLKLIKHGQLELLATATGLGQNLFDLLDLACEPCQDCYNRVMGNLNEAKQDPNLSDIEVESIRLSTRTAGVSEYKPGQDFGLVQALHQGNRGFISMPDTFLRRELEPGKTDERLILLDATQYRRLPGSASTSGVNSASPLDIFMMATTNPGALQNFLEGLEDKQAFTSRSTIIKKPYCVVRLEEERAYKGEWSKFKESAKLDPLVLKMIATVAVLSRFPAPPSAKPFVHPLDKLRLMQGEQIEVKPRSASEWDRIWSVSGSSSRTSDDDRYNALMGYGGPSSSSRGRDTSSCDDPSGEETLSTDTAVSAAYFWKTGRQLDGMAGLDMRFMLGVLSSINELGLRQDKKGEGCVSTLQAIHLMRSALSSALETSNLTEDQDMVLQRCLKWLGGRASDDDTLFSNSRSIDHPEIIESEYRRILRQQLLQVFAPDYDERAQHLYEQYKMHATAASQGDDEVKDRRLGKIAVDHVLIDEIDCYRLGKSKSSRLSDEDKSWRRGLEVVIGDELDRFISNPKNAGLKFKETWQTIPELALAIRTKLDDEIALVVEKLLTTEVTSDLTSEEQQKLISATQQLEALGYCESCQKTMLEYAKRVKVWAHKA